MQRNFAADPNHGTGFFANDVPMRPSALAIEYQFSLVPRQAVIVLYQPGMKRVNPAPKRWEFSQIDIHDRTDKNIVFTYGKKKVSLDKDTQIWIYEGPYTTIDVMLGRIASVTAGQTPIVWVSPIDRLFKCFATKNGFRFTSDKLHYTACARWLHKHDVILDACIGMASIALPPYVLLWIIDWLPGMHNASHRKMIELIVSVRDSMNKIYESREKNENKKNKRV